jgi:hypothetical protein
MTRFQPEHFWLSVKSYIEDIVENFCLYYGHRRDGMEAFFLTCKDNYRDIFWFAKCAMGLKMVCGVVKEIIELNGLDPAEFTNTSGRTTLVTQMAHAGVPENENVGMPVTGH